MTFSMLGEPYSFHHVAAMQYASPDINCHFHAGFDEVLADLAAGTADHAIIAMENSIAGDVPGNYARVLRSGARICGEIFLHLDMHLAGKQSVPVDQLHTVISHPMALKETAAYFRAYPNIRLLPATSTSSAARMVSEQTDPCVAAVANLAAIRFYNLQLIAKNIDKLPNNVTRFLILSNESMPLHATQDTVKASFSLMPGSNFPEGPLGMTRLLDTGEVYLELPVDTVGIVTTRVQAILGSIAGAQLLGIYPEGAFVSGS